MNVAALVLATVLQASGAPVPEVVFSAVARPEAPAAPTVEGVVAEPVEARPAPRSYWPGDPFSRSAAAPRSPEPAVERASSPPSSAARAFPSPPVQTSKPVSTPVARKENGGEPRDPRASTEQSSRVTARLKEPQNVQQALERARSLAKPVEPEAARRVDAPAPAARENRANGAARVAEEEKNFAEPSMDVSRPALGAGSLALEPLRPDDLGAEAHLEQKGGLVPASDVSASGLPGEAASADGEYASRGAELGKPVKLVSDIPDLPEASEEPTASQAKFASSAGVSSWYKIAAGTLFLISLGLIGYRHKQQKQAPSYSWREDQAAVAGSWLPPRAVPRKAVRRSTPLPDPMPLPVMNARAERKVRTAPILREVASDNSALVREVASRPSAASRAERPERARRAELSAPEVVDVPGLPNHEEIERRARRRATADDMAAEKRAPGGRLALSDDSYERVMALSEDGASSREIARDLGLPLAAVTSILKVRKKGSAFPQGQVSRVTH